MTGTGIVPNPDFTLQVDDWVKITIDVIANPTKSPLNEIERRVHFMANIKLHF